jgi:RNA-directed DNA polymerase
MDAAIPACAPSGVAWDGISWADVQRQVRRLQARIVKWTQAGKHNKVKALQWLLTHSFSGSATRSRLCNCSRFQGAWWQPTN